MSKTPRKKDKERLSLPKAPAGIQGLDEITEGGFPRGRPTLICGSAGAGKLCWPWSSWFAAPQNQRTRRFYGVRGD